MTRTNSPTTRRWATRAAVAAAGAGLVAGLAAPAASAAPISTIERGGAVSCTINRDVDMGPVFGGYTQGNCDTRPGTFVRGIGTTDIYSVGQVFLPGGASYSAWVEKFW